MEADVLSPASDAAGRSPKRAATYPDLEAVPEHLVAEILDGELVTHPRPAPRHAIAAIALGAELIAPFQKGNGGPGGWIFMVEPELHFGPQVVVPDLAGWRRERMSASPEKAYIDLPPDWVCEVLSGSTQRNDRGRKRRIYAEAGISHLWLLDPRFQLLEVFTLTGEGWRLEGTWSSDEIVQAPPFDAIALSLANLWPLDRPLGFEESPQDPYLGDR